MWQVTNESTVLTEPAWWEHTQGEQADDGSHPLSPAHGNNSGNSTWLKIKDDLSVLSVSNSAVKFTDKEVHDVSCNMDAKK